MKITLKEWVELHKIVHNLRHTLETADSQIYTMLMKYDPGTEEYAVISTLSKEVNHLRDHCPFPHNYIPQSEWLGGDSSNPNNHCLKEPNIVPSYLKRKFTKEEIEEAGAVNHGPCSWTYSCLTNYKEPKS